MISAVVLTKNEEKNIVDCLESVAWCDERIVIDDYSNDRTVDLAKQTGANILQRELDHDFSAQRNFALSHALGDWILFIDADERVPEDLKNEIIYKLSKKQNTDGYYMRRTDFMWGRQLRHGETSHVWLLRLGKKEKGEWKGRVHEEWNVQGKKEWLESSLHHYPHQTLTEFLKEINYYTEIRARELYIQKKQVKKYEIVLYPLAKFIQNYFFRLGLLDGIPGLIMATLMSFHSFLVRGKLWLLWNGRKLHS